MADARLCQACGAHVPCAKPHLTATTAQGRAARYRRCGACGLLSLEPMPSPVELAAFYNEAYYGLGETKFRGWMEAIRGFGLRRRARRVFALTGRPHRVLDIGAGDGRFLKAMHDLGCEIAGTELEGPAFARAARVPGIRLVAGDVATAGFQPGTFDIVTSWHVLEHMPLPFETIRSGHLLLRAGGALVVEVPNVGCWQSRLTGDKAFLLDPPRHVHQFTAAALAALLERAGFELVRRETASLEMGVLGAVQSGLNTFIKPRDLFYDMLRTRNRCPGGAGAKCASVGLALAAMPVGLALTLAEAARGRGPVLRFFSRKR